MRSSRVILIILLCSFPSFRCVRSGQIPETRKSALTNKDVLEMLNARLSPEVIIAKIRSSACDFDTSPAALKELKAANVPNSVILAMVQAPVVSSKEDATRSSGQPAKIDCRHEGGVPIFSAPRSDPSAVQAFTMKCGERIVILNPDDKQSWLKIRGGDGRVGYISASIVSKEHPADDERPTSATFYSEESPSVTAGTVRALAYRVVPQERTTYYQSGQSSSYTSCYGQGQWSSYGSFGNLNMSTECNTTYTSPTQIPVTWRFADVYNVVETDTQRYVIGCRANWRWSNCLPLTPGDTFAGEVVGGAMRITALKNGKKQITTKYTVLQVTPK